METIKFGRCGLSVSRTGFGALPIQRISKAEAVKILRAAVDGGITLFDSSRLYSDSEEKLGAAFAGVRDQVVIATKCVAKNRTELLKDIDTSLLELRTDYVDIMQLHNPAELPDPADPDSAYAGLMQAKNEGKIRAVGISNHRYHIALQVIESGLYDVLQYPISFLSAERELDLIGQCAEQGMGVIGMKGLSGGLITYATAAFAFLHRYTDLVPIWGIQKESELREFLALSSGPPTLSEEMMETIESYRKELAGDFCRACGYCMPCPQGIQIPIGARMELLLGRVVVQDFLTDEMKARMELIRKCTDCGHCRDHCPYELDAPALLRKNLKYYEQFCNSELRDEIEK